MVTILACIKSNTKIVESFAMYDCVEICHGIPKAPKIAMLQSLRVKVLDFLDADKPLRYL